MEVVASPSQGVEIYYSYFRSCMRLKFVLCPVGVFSEVYLAEAVRNKTQPTFKPGLKQIFSIEVITA